MKKTVKSTKKIKGVSKKTKEVVQTPVASTPPANLVNIRCRQEGCGSMTALDVTPKENPRGQNVYACTKCHKVWGVNTGSGISI